MLFRAYERQTKLDQISESTMIFLRMWAFR